MEYPCAMNIIRVDPLHRNDPFDISVKPNTNNKHIMGCNDPLPSSSLYLL